MKITKNRTVLYVSIFFAVLIALAVAGYIYVSGMIRSYGIQEKTKTYIEAIVLNDPVRLRSVSYSQTSDLDKIKEKLRNKKTRLSGEVFIHRMLGCGFRTLKDGKIVSADFRVKVGSDTFRVSVEYQIDSDGEGIKELIIYPKGDENGISLHADLKDCIFIVCGLRS